MMVECLLVSNMVQKHREFLWLEDSADVCALTLIVRIVICYIVGNELNYYAQRVCSEET